MTSAAERQLLVAEAERIIREGSKSFRFASNLFDEETRERAWLLYCWCRACDDLADGQTLGHNAVAPADPAARIAFLRETTDRALAGETIGFAPFDALRVVAAECAIPRRFIDDHLAGFALDAEGWRPLSEDDMLRYCYHVAGAVGCMMAVIMGVDPSEEDTLDRAADLGLAFQLSNIARKVAARGPAAWDSRTVIHKPAKLFHVINALVECGDRPAPVDRAGLWKRPRG